MSSDSDAPTTPRAGEPQTVEERVHFIAEQMAANEWPPWPDTLAHRRALAARWGVVEATIRKYAAEAHRLLAIDADDRERLREQIAREMREIYEEAKNTPNRQTDIPDYASAIKALDLSAKYAGIELEQKVKVSGSVSLEDLDELRKRVENAGE